MKQIERTSVGWIKVHRVIKDWKYFRDGKYLTVWLSMLMDANFAPQEFEGVTIDRGELVFTYRTWEKKYKDFKPAITLRNLRTILGNLEKNGDIVVRHITDKKITVVKIVNYDRYQGHDELHESQRKPTQLTREFDTVRPESDIIEPKIDTVAEEESTAQISVIKEVESTDYCAAFENRHSNDQNRHSNDQNRHSNDQEPPLLKECFKESKNTTNIKSHPDGLPADVESFIKDVIDHLNKTTGHKRTYTAKDTVKYLKLIFESGGTREDCYKVIDVKSKQWDGIKFNGKTEASVFLRPKTLFHPDKFEDYLIDANNYYKVPNDSSLPDYMSQEDWEQYEQKQAQKEKEKEEALKAEQEEKELAEMWRLVEKQRQAKKIKVVES